MPAADNSAAAHFVALDVNVLNIGVWAVLVLPSGFLLVMKRRSLTETGIIGIICFMVGVTVPTILDCFR